MTGRILLESLPICGGSVRSQIEHGQFLDPKISATRGTIINLIYNLCYY